ncbi:unnamed protein product [Vitrella brassicaformis CCMP3155]|uniref:Uncharacterized protein n=1 Tax=Vitrella brassicaformis (strain CCMP3155) TaxID=1169540 RepID=A0A0G4G0N8_VITBC|nr:unnamed protein product [Vitrella brassicaformis CCMP3155]|mmetsp:Transcript_12202/g.29232  ORF Transcript_12202/g.29232 Transcript_12202/m.29232 type:complete len:145 (+) Transcript_12202:336-770(+)|eukprot:CEM21103.1 unnamed protein product [Vitrella brassicaformis CCMP3155]
MRGAFALLIGAVAILCLVYQASASSNLSNQTPTSSTANEEVVAPLRKTSARLAEERGIIWRPPNEMQDDGPVTEWLLINAMQHDEPAMRPTLQSERHRGQMQDDGPVTEWLLIKSMQHDEPGMRPRGQPLCGCSASLLTTSTSP